VSASTITPGLVANELSQNEINLAQLSKISVLIRYLNEFGETVSV
jgi:hypothetical protein